MQTKINVWTSQGGTFSVSAPLSTLQSHNSGTHTFPLRGSHYLQMCHANDLATEGLILELEVGWLWSGQFASRAINIKAINGLRCWATQDTFLWGSQLPFTQGNRARQGNTHIFQIVLHFYLWLMSLQLRWWWRFGLTSQNTHTSFPRTGASRCRLQLTLVFLVKSSLKKQTR